jgi:hypothetical protein
MPTPEAMVASFRELDFHDDTFMDLRVAPPQARNEGVRSVVEIVLLQYSEKKRRTLRFSGCTNLRVAMDFDVLADNYPPNTSSIDAHANPIRLRELMLSQKKDWDVVYAAGSESPLSQKVGMLHQFVAFRVQFFGGVIEVIARNYDVETVDQE